VRVVVHASERDRLGSEHPDYRVAMTLAYLITARFRDVVSLVHAAILRPATHALNGDMSPQRHLATPAIHRALGNCGDSGFRGGVNADPLNTY
jgi:hypothetical protein